MNNISTNITYNNVVYSSTATAKGIDNIPDAEQLLNAEALALNVLEPLISKFGKLIFNSWFRNKELNKAVKGSANSQHMTAQAVDIEVKAPYTNAQLFEHIKNNLPFDQLIWEKGTDKEPEWIHVSYSRIRNRKQILYIK